MNTKSIVVTLSLLVLGACGASITGPATSDPGDPCKGHLSCPRGCCWEANSDGEGFDCIGTEEARAGICVYVGGIVGTPKVEDRPKPPDPTPSSVEPAEPPPVRHDGQG